MAIVINMPQLSDTMTEGVVAKWHIKIGDVVTEGLLLAEIETDKATLDFESFPGQEGELLYIGTKEGEAAPVNSILAIIGEKGEDISALLTASAASESPVESKPSKEAAPAKVVSAPVAPVTPAPAASASTGRIKASPLAKSLAADKGLNLAGIVGSGEGGRIVKRDIEVAAAAPIVASPAVAQNYPSSGYIDTPVSQMRKVIASRLGESKFSAPHFYVSMSIDMGAAMASRSLLNAESAVKISFNDMVVKAVAKSLKKHPAVNSSWLGDVIRTNFDVHVGIAVAVEDGLLVPVVRHADAKSLSDISTEVKSFAQRARDKQLQPQDWEGNTFTISNLGMFGVEDFTAIINPPDACILAIGGIQSVPVVKDGEIVPGHVMKVTLSCDHRAVDGATGAAFLNSLKAFLESPVTMLL
ncbi:MAG: 2-oxo acid dehydrogenase subunit E2 [Flavobacteriales bacterium]|jgi:pyruvate dehydrogenase E2 component (dihydrolipoamide acetyltransferase)|nr:2-oxo acid dehydrogenase subunit E2 [Flavobacteriales bacterium]NCF57621.1 dihydrolipoamide acyltransferase [Bacteroidota bacterium]MBT3572969.1 2-oxo acid dehydrogenase subunit E2 [Flavobacteriales bacterium]MBT3677782.1 2-oxo acid dehydrogenase subunit E2 [Flavobacteriales bacterium]MBT3739877.1 2-oxo acid dehydrogenase subunit E2 [Flavobacteriales bacterium]